MKKLPVLTSAYLSLLIAASASGAEKQKPYPHYWMSISTISQNMPGMSQEMTGMAEMFGGKNMFGPRREILLQLESPKTVETPKAEHDIPPGQKMGDSLPLITPFRKKTADRPEQYERQEKYEKPKARMLIYWGCGDTVRKGQPKIVDTATMSMTEFGKAFAGRTPTRHTPPSPRKGWTYGEWPDKNNKTEIPPDSSLIGKHLIKGNYLLPEINFYLDAKRDYMAPVEFTPLSITTEGAAKVEWKEIPTAIGYFATAMGHNQDTGESIFWSASEVPEIGFGLMDYLTPSDVNRFLKEKVLLPTTTTTCTIPPIFKGDQPGMLQFIAYGEEQNYVHPPKPKNPKTGWNIEWSAKVRLKSTSMLPLMAVEVDDSPRKSSSSRKSKHQSMSSDYERDNSSKKSTEDEDQNPKESLGIKEMGNRLKGMFGF